MQEDGGRIKAVGKMRHADFLNWVRKKLQEGWQIYSCYEAGASGYWLHRELGKMGVKNLVVVSKGMGGGKKQKTDKQYCALMRSKAGCGSGSPRLLRRFCPKGVGAYSAAVFEYEMRGFERFSNRRQVGSMTGLCPGIHQSDGRGKEGSINRCGIGIVRWTLVEMVWRLIIWQPQYPPVRRLATGLVKGKACSSG
jgi:transposase